MDETGTIHMFSRFKSNRFFRSCSLVPFREDILCARPLITIQYCVSDTGLHFPVDVAEEGHVSSTVCQGKLWVAVFSCSLCLSAP